MTKEPHCSRLMRFVSTPYPAESEDGFLMFGFGGDGAFALWKHPLPNPRPLAGESWREGGAHQLTAVKKGVRQ